MKIIRDKCNRTLLTEEINLIRYKFLEYFEKEDWWIAGYIDLSGEFKPLFKSRSRCSLHDQIDSFYERINKTPDLYVCN